MAKKKIVRSEGEQIFVYHDADHGDIELFDTLEAAKAHAEKNWPDAMDEGQGWEDCGRGRYSLGEYVTIYTKHLVRSK